MKRYTVYLAGPIAGLSHQGASEWRESVAARLDSRIEALSPMRAKQHLSGCGPLPPGGYQGHPHCNDKGIVARDLSDVRRSDIILLNLLGADKASVGSMVELGYAAALGKVVVAALEQGSAHDHLFVRQLAAFVVPDLYEAVAVVHAVLLPEGHLVSRHRQAA